MISRQNRRRTRRLVDAYQDFQSAIQTFRRQLIDSVKFKSSNQSSSKRLSQVN